MTDLRVSSHFTCLTVTRPLSVHRSISGSISSFPVSNLQLPGFPLSSSPPAVSLCPRRRNTNLALSKQRSLPLLLPFLSFLLGLYLQMVFPSLKYQRLLSNLLSGHLTTPLKVPMDLSCLTRLPQTIPYPPVGESSKPGYHRTFPPAPPIPSVSESLLYRKQSRRFQPSPRFYLSSVL